MTEQRKITIGTSLGKKYTGLIDAPSATFRTIDLFNSANIFWKNPNEKCFENAILMYDARLMFGDTALYRKFDKIQIKLPEIFYFYDGFQSMGDEMEKKRTAKLIELTQEKIQTVNIITKVVANSFYDIEGKFFGLFKKKSNDKFLPLTDVKIVEISKKEGKWFKNEIILPHKFIGMANSLIESAVIG
jgi:hypothetical protein